MNTISVIVPIFYGEKYIRDIIYQIESSKTFLTDRDYIEILFINDSPEAPFSLKWKSSFVNIIVINLECHVGIHAARVKGLKECHGEYILFLDQDDKIKPEYFRSQIQAIGNGDAVVCKAIEAGQPFYIGNNVFENMITKDFILKMWNPIISPGQVFLKKDSIPDVWIENIIQYNGADDWFLWLCMMSEGKTFSCNPNILFEHVIQGNNASDNILNMLLSEQEVLKIIWEKNILTEKEWGWILDSYLKKNMLRTQRLYFAREKLNIIEKWMKLSQEGVNFAKQLVQAEYSTASIYGCGVLGNYLYDEIKEIIDVRYFIDINAKEIQKAIPVFSMDDELPDIDCVIVSLVGNTKTVVNKIKSKLNTKVFVLKEWIKTMELSES